MSGRLLLPRRDRLGMEHSQQDEMDFAVALVSSAGFADQVDAVAVEYDRWRRIAGEGMAPTPLH